MRTKAILSAAAALAVGAFTAQAQVYSVNIVGYVNQTFAGGGFTAAANPLDDGTNTLGSALMAVPTGGQVQLWTGSGFSSVSRVPFGSGWTGGAGAATPIPPGQGFFISMPAGPSITNTWVGEVLTGDLTNGLPAGFSFKGNQVPVAGSATDIGLTAALPTAGSQVQQWTGSGYNAFSRVPFGTGWTPSVPNFSVAEGWFVNNAGPASQWVQTFNP